MGSRDAKKRQFFRIPYAAAPHSPYSEASESRTDPRTEIRGHLSAQSQARVTHP